MRNTLGLLQNAIDLIAAFFLIFGGWNATNSNTLAGYSCITLGPVLLYLSSGMWTKQIGKLIGRSVFYGTAFLALGLSVIILASVHAMPSVDRWVIYLVLSVLFGAFALSLVHLRLVRQQVAGTS